ncbi:YrdB family protein [Rhizobium tropici]|uniref:YrdB family protein n=3 Tax=Rhizobium tropici TaxID=398 RepID=A0A6P1CBG3_RHITR|nr:YrdB family protein [Rhizobium tropici]
MRAVKAPLSVQASWKRKGRSYCATVLSDQRFPDPTPPAACGCSGPQAAIHCRLKRDKVIRQAVATFWGKFLSPKRRYEVGPAGRLILEAGIFLITALILNHLGWPTLAIALVVVAAANRIALALIP